MPREGSGLTAPILLNVGRRWFRGLGFKVRLLGFRVLGFRALGF